MLMICFLNGEYNSDDDKKKFHHNTAHSTPLSKVFQREINGLLLIFPWYFFPSLFFVMKEIRDVH